MLSRRQLLLAAAAAVPAAALIDANPADARPFVLADSRVRGGGPVMQIGDSTSGGYLNGLQRTIRSKDIGPFRCDIQGARSINRVSKRFPSAISAIRTARAAGFDPPCYLLALGSNDLWVVKRKKNSAPAMIDAIMNEIGPDRTVGFLTLYTVHQSSAPKFNAALREATKRWPNLHIMDWAAVARRNVRWHNEGGVHYTMRGAIARNRYLAHAMVRTVKIARSQPPVTTTTTTSSTTTLPTTTLPTTTLPTMTA